MLVPHVCPAQWQATQLGIGFHPPSGREFFQLPIIPVNHSIQNAYETTLKWPLTSRWTMTPRNLTVL
jgi:hypothetical protein